MKTTFYSSALQKSAAEWEPIVKKRRKNLLGNFRIILLYRFKTICWDCDYPSRYISTALTMNNRQPVPVILDEELEIELAIFMKIIPSEALEDDEYVFQFPNFKY